MTRPLKRATAPLFGLLVALALGFGVRTATAAPAGTDCPYNPPTNLGTCFSDLNCNTKCVKNLGSTYSGECVYGCCICEPIE